MKVQLTERAVQLRINRKLQGDGQKLHKASPKVALSMGRFFITDDNTGSVERHGISDLTELAREMDLLKPFEEIEND